MQGIKLNMMRKNKNARHKINMVRKKRKRKGCSKEKRGVRVGISRITTSDFAPLVVRLVEVVMTQESNMQILVVWEVRMG